VLLRPAAGEAVRAAALLFFLLLTALPSSQDAVAHLKAAGLGPSLDAAAAGGDASEAEFLMDVVSTVTSDAVGLNAALDASAHDGLMKVRNRLKARAGRRGAITVPVDQGSAAQYVERGRCRRCCYYCHPPFCC
jgi:hypothetical protein